MKIIKTCTCKRDLRGNRRPQIDWSGRLQQATDESKYRDNKAFKKAVEQRDRLRMLQLMNDPHSDSEDEGAEVEANVAPTERERIWNLQRKLSYELKR